MRILSIILLVLLSLLPAPMVQAQLNMATLSSLPAINDSTPHHGWAGAFVGVHNDRIIMAGGSAFPDGKPWEGGLKHYSDGVMCLSGTPADNTWEEVSSIRLPQPLANGAAVSTPNGVLCAGGQSPEGYSNRVFMIASTAPGAFELTNLPALPMAISGHGMTLIGETVYLVGGRSPKGDNTKMWTYHINRPEEGWTSAGDVPFVINDALVVSQSNGIEQCLYLIGGRHRGVEQPTTAFSAEVWQYTPSSHSWLQKSNWQIEGKGTINLAAAAGLKSGASHIIVVGGDNGQTYNKVEGAINRMQASRGAEYEQARAQRDSLWKHHPGFSRSVLVYNTITDRWFEAGTLATAAPAVSAAVTWQGQVVVPAGEIKPGIRTDQVLALDFTGETGFGWVNYLVLVLYFVGMLALGFYFMRRENDEEDFFKAGGRIPWWAAGISIFATTLSAITFIAIPAKAYATDWRMLVFNLTIILVAPVVIKYYLPFFRRLKIGTAYEYLELRFNRAVRWMASAFFIIFMVTRIAVVLFLPSLALHAVTGFSVYWSIIIMGIVTIIYCTSGGIEAVVWGDVIQGFILLGGALMALVFMLFGVDGGLGGFIDISMDNQKFFLLDGSLDWSKPVLWVVVLGGFANSLIAYTSDQSVVQRYMTTKDENATSKSIWLNGILSIPVSIIFFLLGTGLFAFYTSNPEDLSVSIPNLDAVFPHFIVSELPAGLAGLLIAAVFAAAMSTLSSNINSVSAVITSDFFDVLVPQAKRSSSLLIARWSGVLVGVFGILMALVLATWDIASLWDQFNTFLGLLTGGLGALFVMGIFFKRISGKAAFLGVIVGFVALLWLRDHATMSFLLYGAAGIIISVFVAYLLSFVWPQKDEVKGLTFKSIMD
ncbi:MULTISPECIES: sodium:solute symporter family transporter [unclassified Carboxylicivirga]|uniref:sodium:solute symporter family transporter n=1 Tax=Carboxylicivirga TaxID=1628153 RepID=UPI003D327144